MPGPSASGLSVEERLRPCADAVARWRERAPASPPPASPTDARELLGVFSRCQTVADLEAIAQVLDLGITDPKGWVDAQCRRFPLERELGQTPLCRDARATH